MEERLQKILAAAGVASRREAEKIITAGRVRVNGKVVTELGCKFDADKVRISVDGKPIAQEAKAYYMFYKPRGVVTTMSDPPQHCRFRAEPAGESFPGRTPGLQYRRTVAADE